MVSSRDPGVPNWLDVADNRAGILQLRLNRAAPVPDPVCRLVKIDEVRAHLPADTPHVSPEARAGQLRARAEAAQMRIYW